MLLMVPLENPHSLIYRRLLQYTKIPEKNKNGEKIETVVASAAATAEVAIVTSTNDSNSN